MRTLGAWSGDTGHGLIHMSRVERTTNLECGANPAVAHSVVHVSLSGPTYVMHVLINHEGVRCPPMSGMHRVFVSETSEPIFILARPDWRVRRKHSQRLG